MAIAERQNFRESISGFAKNLRNKTNVVFLATVLSAGGSPTIASAHSIENLDMPYSPTPVYVPFIENNNMEIEPSIESQSIESISSMQLKTDYSFQVSLNYDTSTISAVETVNVVNNSVDNVSELNFSVLPKATREFTLGRVMVDGQQEQTVWSNNSNLVVDLPQSISQGESTTVEIDFEDHPSSNISTFLGSSLSKRNGIMQVSNWFPILSNGHAMRMPGDSQFSSAASYHMELDLNRPMVVAAPGIVSSPNSTSRVVDFGPARNLAFAVSPDFVEQTGNVDGIEVDVFSKSSSAGGKALNIAKSALNTFDSKLIAYPYNRFVVAQGTRPISGNEFPGIVFVGSKWLGSTEVVTHETSHQWFYGMLGNDQMQEPWLDEGFAEWAGTGFSGHNYCSTKPVDSSVYAFPNKFDYLTTSTCGSYDQTIYFKGATFIQGVRTRMGDSAFFNSLNNLFSDYRFGIINTSIVADNWLNYTAADNRASLTDYMRGFISL